MREGNSQPLRGQTALITGSGKRIGAAIATELHANGANVVLHSHHSRAEAEALAFRLNALREHSAILASADLLCVDSLPGLIELALKAFGRLDLCINNASSFYATPVGQISERHWEDLIGTNLKAPLFLAQAAAEALRATRGAIINIVDIHGLRPLSGYPVYSIAKAGLIMLTRSLARELAPAIRVNAIAPGPVLWPESGLDSAGQQRIVEHTLLKRPGAPSDIARTVLFFAAQAPYITGQVLAVDGGRSVGW